MLRVMLPPNVLDFSRRPLRQRPGYQVWGYMRQYRLRQREVALRAGCSISFVQQLIARQLQPRTVRAHDRVAQLWLLLETMLRERSAQWSAQQQAAKEEMPWRRKPPPRVDKRATNSGTSRRAAAASARVRAPRATVNSAVRTAKTSVTPPA